MTGPESFLLTNRSGCLSVDGIDDVHDFSETIVSWERTWKHGNWSETHAYRHLMRAFLI